MPSHTLQGMLSTAYMAWQRCFKKLAKRPRLKGQRNKLSSIPFPDSLKPPVGNTIGVPGIGRVRFHKQRLPDGRIKMGRIVKRASGWYLCLFIDTTPQAIPHTGQAQVGIDPGFHHLLTLSSGEKIPPPLRGRRGASPLPHPHELRQTAQRLAQAQRGKRQRLAARLQERLANQRTDRNHKLSRRLVAEHQTIVWSKDGHRAIAKTFGKSVASAGHAQLRGMLAYKCTASGRRFLEVPSRFSTKTCSACGSLSGPTGYAGLPVRQWTCVDCGAVHDRDINAAMNTLAAGVGTTHERCRKAVSGIPAL
jgi:transposase